MTFFQKRFHKSNLKRLCSVCLFALLLFLFSHTADSIRQSNAAEQMAILEKAVNRSITQCYALEGTYPPNMEYLTAHYGLTYDEDLFFVDYQTVGANIYPDVTIIEKGAGK